MGDFQKHLDLAKEKFKATINAYNNEQSTVVGDLGTKVVEQLVEADAANKGEHVEFFEKRFEVKIYEENT